MPKKMKFPVALIIVGTLLLSMFAFACVEVEEPDPTPLTYSVFVSGGTASAGGQVITGKIEAGVEVTLTPENKTDYIFVSWSSNDIAVTNNKFIMPAKDVNITAVFEEEIINRTLTIVSEDITFVDGESSVELLKDSAFPEIVNSKTDAELIGWYNVDNDSIFWNQSLYRLRNGTGVIGNAPVDVPVFSMPAADTTVAPFFSLEGQRPLVPGSHQIDSGIKDSVTRKTSFFETNIGTQIGAQFDYSGSAYVGTGTTFSASSGGFFRILSSCASANDSASPGYISEGEHTFNFWFKNVGEETIKFTAYQLSGGLNIISGADTGLITLEPGESCLKSITVTVAGNWSAITAITLGQDQENAKLGIVMTMSVDIDE